MPTDPLRILFVEDHLDTLDCLERLFRTLGYLTRTATTCASARASLRDHGAVDVVVSDVGLPDGDGIALLEELKHAYKVGSVAFTARVMAADIKRYERSSIDCCIRKPCGVTELQRAVESVALASRPTRRTA